MADPAVQRRGYGYWLEVRKGNFYRRRNGTVIYRLDDLKLDDSLFKHYGFFTAFPQLTRLRVIGEHPDEKSGSRVGNVVLSEFESHFVKCDEHGVEVP
jgi:hypothetical protein